MPVACFKNTLNGAFSNKEPWQIATITASTVLLSVWLYQFLFEDEEYITVRAKKTFFKYMKKIPSIKKKMQDELNSANKGFQNDMAKRFASSKHITRLSKTNMETDEIYKLADINLKLGTYSWSKGRVSGSVYFNDDNLRNLVKEMYAKASYTNPLHSDVFPGICKMETEVVKMCARLFHGDDDTCGTMTTGGTESILMACKAYRDYASEVKGIKRPEMVLPVTAHAAFDKAAQYFKIRLRVIPVHTDTYQVDLKAFKRAINGNTIMLVGSAPNFPYGTMDDIGAISDLGVKFNIPVHVDSCLGGFLTAFMEDAGYPAPHCDFRLPGVTSISADTHKYGYAPKGTSIVLYRSIVYLHHQYTTTTDWPGGVYGSPTINGSRAGGAIAACWATMLYFGVDRYIQATREIIYTTRYIEKRLREIKDIFIFGQPATSVIAIGSHIFDVYRLQSALAAKGWNLNILQFPSGIHFCITTLHTTGTIADDFVTDVKSCVAEIMKDPGQPVQGKMAVYGAAQQIPDRDIVGDVINYYLDAMYYIPPENVLE